MITPETAYKTIQKFEEIGFDTWFRNNEDHIADNDRMSIELCQAKFEDGKWGYEIRLYAADHGNAPFFKERMTTENGEEFYFSMINKKVCDYLLTMK